MPSRFGHLTIDLRHRRTPEPALAIASSARRPPRLRRQHRVVDGVEYHSAGLRLLSGTDGPPAAPGRESAGSSAWLGTDPRTLSELFDRFRRTHPQVRS